MHGRQTEHNHRGRISHNDLYATRWVGKTLKVMPQLVRSCVKLTPTKGWESIDRMENMGDRRGEEEACNA